MSANIQTLEKLIKVDHRDSHIQKREEQPKVFKQPPLICPMTLQEFPNDRSPQSYARFE